MRARYLGLAAVITVALGLRSDAVAAQPPATDVPANPFTRPTGRFAVGTYDWLWIDQARPERYTKDPADKRRLPVQVWYPADSALGEPAPYVRAPEEFGPTSAFKAMEQVKTNAWTGAPVAKAERKYPVLIYNHGAGWSRFSATFVTEELASHGYVVFSIDHPGLDRTVLFSDGTAFKADTLQLPPPDPKQDMRVTAGRSMTFLNTIAFPMWIEDSRYVLDEVEKLNEASGPFQGRLDLDRIGMLGWSFGGATAVEMIRVDPRVKAAVNHDGRLFGGVMTEPTKRPFMLFHHGIDDVALAPEANRAAMREMMVNMQGYDSTARTLAGGDWYDLTIARTNHGHFSDLLLFRKPDSTLMPARRAHEIISVYTLAFFDRYLKGRKSPLLDAASPEYPEVAFRRKER